MKTYKRISYAINIIALIMLILCVLAYKNIIFRGDFAARKWVWYFTGLAFINPAFSITRIKGAIFGKREVPVKPLMLSFAVLFISGMVWASIHPMYTPEDMANIYLNNKTRFHALAEQRYAYIEKNDCYKCRFEYTGKRFNMSCDSFIIRHGMRFELEEEKKDEIMDFMDKYNFSTIVMDSASVHFYFSVPGEAPHIVMLQYPVNYVPSGMTKIDTHYFIQY
jgi:hypothetical protein